MLGSGDPLSQTWPAAECTEGFESCQAKGPAVLIVEEQDDPLGSTAKLGGGITFQELCDRLDGIVEALGVSLDDRLFDEIWKVLEMVVERTMGHTRLLEDLRQSDLLDGVGLEQFDGGVEEFLGRRMQCCPPTSGRRRLQRHGASPFHIPPI